MAFQVSPGVNVSEIDLTTVVPSVSTTAAATVGQFQWGPAEKRRLITSENDLVNVFGKPDGNTAVSFFSAANFLAYGNNLQIVRVANTGSNNSLILANTSLHAGGGANAQNSGTANALANIAAVKLIKNEDVYDQSYALTDSYLATFAARYPGALGNTLKVSVWDANTANSNVFNSNNVVDPANATPQSFSAWTYKSYFPSAPSTSTFVSSQGGADDQFHLVVVDEDGLFSNGVKGTVLEVFPFLSKASDAVSDDGSSTYYRNVISEQSRYIYSLGPLETRPQANVANGATAFSSTMTNWGSTASGTIFSGCCMGGANTGATFSFKDGRDLVISDTEYTTGIDLFENKEEVDISLIVTGAASDTSQGDWIDLAGTRKDCIAFVSPPQTVVTSATPADVVSTWINTDLNKASSYAVADSGWKYQFDKYNNVYRWIPLNADIAGLCVRTDLNNDPWFSPAGFNRGQIRNVVKLAWNPSQAQRDNLYGLGVNPVASFPGQGTILYGDKTLLKQPSAFDRINVRRLFITLEKAIANAARFSLFELNDETTRAQFVGLVEPFLRDVKGRRGITDFRVVCDTTNNTPQVIDSNRFVGDIYIKPTRSINYIQLNFVAVRSGVQFSEIAGGL
jgi:phage tail sheath protein FI